MITQYSDESLLNELMLRLQRKEEVTANMERVSYFIDVLVTCIEQILDERLLNKKKKPN